MGLDQYMFAVKNGVVKLDDVYDWEHPLVDKIFVPATEIAYWRKNRALQQYFYTPCDIYKRITKKNIEQLINNITLGWNEFGYPDYIEDRKAYDLEVFNIALGYIDDDFSIYYEADW